MKNPWRKIYDHPQSVDPFKNGVPKAPLYLDVEPTNHCNFNCIFCEGKQAERPKGYMDYVLFEDICRQATDMGVKGIRFLRWGEPLMHNFIIYMMGLVGSYGMLTHITTNGSLITRSMAQGLIDAGLDSIIISMQGTTTNEYNKIRGINFDKVDSGIHNIVELRKNNPHIAISTTVTDETEEDVKAFKKKWESIVDYVGVGYTRLKRLKNKPAYLEDRTHKMPTKFKCIEVMNKLSIDWDGAVSPCCLDYDQQLTIANIKEKSLKDIWNCEEIKAIRTLLTAKLQDIFVLCSTCELNYDFRGQE